MTTIETIAGVVVVFAFAAFCLSIGVWTECWMNDTPPAAHPCRRCGGSGKEPVE